MNINILDAQTLIYCLSFLNPRDFANVSAVSPRWKILSDDEFLWQHFCLQTFGAMTLPKTAPQNGWKSYFKSCLVGKNLANPDFIPKLTTVKFGSKYEICRPWIVNNVLVVVKDNLKTRSCSFLLKDLETEREINLEGFTYVNFYSHRDVKQKGERLVIQADHRLLSLDLAQRNLKNVQLVQVWESATPWDSFDIEGNTLALLRDSSIELIDLESGKSRKFETDFSQPIDITLTKRYIVVKTNKKKVLLERETPLLHRRTFASGVRIHITNNEELYVHCHQIYHLNNLTLKTELIYNNDRLIAELFSNNNRILFIINDKNSSNLVSLNRHKPRKAKRRTFSFVSNFQVNGDIALLRTRISTLFVNINNLQVVRESHEDILKIANERFALFEQDEGSFKVFDGLIGQKKGKSPSDDDEFSDSDPDPMSYLSVRYSDSDSYHSESDTDTYTWKDIFQDYQPDDHIIGVFGDFGDDVDATIPTSPEELVEFLNVAINHFNIEYNDSLEPLVLNEEAVDTFTMSEILRSISLLYIRDYEAKGIFCLDNCKEYLKEHVLDWYNALKSNNSLLFK